MKITQEILIIDTPIGFGKNGGYSCFSGGKVIILKTLKTYRLKNIEAVQNELIDIGYKPASKLTRSLFRWSMKYIREVPQHQCLFAAGKLLKILYTDEDIKVMKNYKSFFDFSKAPHLMAKRIDGKIIYTMTTHDGKVYEAYKQ